jgi:hypothetical protein
VPTRRRRRLRSSSAWGRRSRREAALRKHAPPRTPRADRGASAAMCTVSPRSSSITSWLSRSTRRPSRPEDSASDLGTGPRPSRRLGEPLAGERPSRGAHLLGSGHDERAQLIESGGTRPDRASALEQEQAQVLAPAASAREREPRASEQAPRGRDRIDRVVLAPPALPGGSGARTPRPRRLARSRMRTSPAP